MKHTKLHTYVLKLHSDLLCTYNWNYSTTLEEIRKDSCSVISLGDSQVLTWITQFNNTSDNEEKAKNIKNDIKFIKKQPPTKQNKQKIRENYSKLYNLKFLRSYIEVIFDKKSHLNEAVKRGIKIDIDGETIIYRHCIGTPNGIKKNTIVFIDEKILSKLDEYLDGGRNKEIPLVPAKLEAYRALSFSSSVVLENEPRIVVVKDCITHPIISKLIHLDFTNEDLVEPEMSEIYDTEIEVNANDGFGLCSPEFAKKVNLQLNQVDSPNIAFNLRYLYTKGVVVTFNFIQFAKEVAKNFIIKDVWGNEHDIREIDMILTESQVKLWNCYKSLDDYLENSHKYKYEFRVSKATHGLDEIQTSNFQFLQGYSDLTDDEINELIEPTVSMIKDSLGKDWRKTVLYMCGKGLDDETVQYADATARAIMAYPEAINDYYIRQRVERMIDKSIKEAKIGVLQLRGNFSIITGDPYSLAQSIFGLPVTGLLKAHEYYSRYWIDKRVDKVAAFRAPMTSQRNCDVFNITHNEDMDYWYQYITETLVINSWDETMMRFNGCDFDGDTMMTTDNKVLIENYVHRAAIDCASKSPQKIVPIKQDFVDSERRGFSGSIGTITNHGTEQISMQSSYDKSSKEYEILDYRVTCCMLFQQSAIDAVKGCWSRPMPKFWTDIHSIKDLNDNYDKDLYRRLVTKKPYFMIWRYAYVYRDYQKYIKSANSNSLLRFGKSLSSLIENQESDEEKEFVSYYYKYLPVDTSPGIVNRISWRVEEMFKNKNALPDVSFDYHMFCSVASYTKEQYDAVCHLYSEYMQKIREIKQIYALRDSNGDSDQINADMFVFKEQWKEKCLSVCNNEKVLTNILLEICYNSSNSKTMVWDLCGEQIVRNLLEKNNNTFKIPIRSTDGDIEFNGDKFIIKEVKIDEKSDI